MLKVGITGNFHSGHREIVKHFYKSVTPVFDADLMIKYLLNYNPKTIDKIKEKFGTSAYSWGKLDLFKFDTNGKFEKLLDTITPEIFSKYKEFTNKNFKYPYTLFLSSILFEKDWDKEMNYTINVFNPNMVRKKQIMSKTKIDLNMIEFILENEMDEYSKNSKSNFVIHNYGGINLDFKVKNEILQIHSNIIRNFGNIDYIKTF